MKPGELRAGARRLWQVQTRPPWDAQFLRPGDLPIAEVPAAPGCVLCIGLVPGKREGQRANERGNVVLQTMRLGVRGTRASITSKIFVPAHSLPLFAEAIARAMEIASGDEAGILPGGDVWDDRG